MSKLLLGGIALLLLLAVTILVDLPVVSMVNTVLAQQGNCISEGSIDDSCDQDKDGVLDQYDRCVLVPGPADNDGCPYTATQPPATTPPPTTPPATQPPATQPPATQPPATQPPATQPPATQPPATQPPATQPPATQPPATQAPATTAAQVVPPPNVITDSRVAAAQRSLATLAQSVFKQSTVVLQQQQTIAEGQAAIPVLVQQQSALDQETQALQRLLTKRSQLMDIFQFMLQSMDKSVERIWQVQ